MANNPYINKVEYGSDVLIDLTQDTVTSDHMLAGTTAHLGSGASATGTIPTYNGDYTVVGNE